MQLARAIHTETRHAGSRCRTRIGGIQYIEQTITVRQADRANAAGREDADEGEMAVQGVNDGNLVASGVGSKEPLTGRQDQRPLRPIGKGGQAAQAANGSHAQQLQRAFRVSSEGSNRVGAAQVVIQHVDIAPVSTEGRSAMRPASPLRKDWTCCATGTTAECWNECNF